MATEPVLGRPPAKSEYINPDQLDYISPDEVYDSAEYEPKKDRLVRLGKGMSKELKEGIPGPLEGSRIGNYTKAALPIGAAEAGLQAVSGLASSAVGGIAGGLETAGRFALGQDFDKAAAEGAKTVETVQRAATYQPRTNSGQLISELMATPMELASAGMGYVGEKAGGLVGPKTAAAGRTIGEASVPIAGTLLGGAGAMKAAPKAAAAFPKTLGAQIGGAPAPAAPTMGGVGAGNLTAEQARIANQKSLPGAPPLAAAQASADPVAVTRLKEAAKRPGGERIISRIEEQQEFIPEHLDRLIDKTDAQLPLDAWTFGGELHDVVGKYVKRFKNAITKAYERAEASPEADMKVVPSNLESVFAGLEEKGILESTGKRAPILNMIRSGMNKMKEAGPKEGPAILGPDGKPLRPAAPEGVSVRQMEDLRKMINRFTDIDGDSVDFRMGSELKRAIDKDLENSGSALYKEARALRKSFGERFEDHKVLSDLVKMKGGDLKIPVEHVFDRLILNGDRAGILHLRKVLREADPSNQIWKEVQGQTVKYLLEQTISNRVPMQSGKFAPSAAKLKQAINKLEIGGKMDTILGKSIAEEIRALQRYADNTIVDVANNFINRSNTAVISELGKKGFFGKVAEIAEKTTRPIKGVHALTEYALKAAEKSNIERIATEELGPKP